MELEVFHGTDRSCAKDIVSQRVFIVKENTQHWLGNGIYFYIDCGLADWWTTRPTKKFGSEIKRPAIVKCRIEVDKAVVLDLRTKSDYNKCADLCHSFYHDYYKKYAKKPLRQINLNKFRCTFFDWLFAVHNVKVIIGTFSGSVQEYLTPTHTEFENLKLKYTEVQVCVAADCQDVIKSFELVDRRRIRHG